MLFADAIEVPIPYEIEEEGKRRRRPARSAGARAVPRRRALRACATTVPTGPSLRRAAQSEALRSRLPPTRPAGWSSPPTTSPPPTAPAWSTPRPLSAPTTTRPASSTACRCCRRSKPTARSPARRDRALRRALVQGRGRRRSSRDLRSAACSSTPIATGTATRSAGAATSRSCSTPPRAGSSRRPRCATGWWPRTGRSAGTRRRSARAASATGSRAWSTGRLSRNATGARRCRSGSATSARRARSSSAPTTSSSPLLRPPSGPPISTTASSSTRTGRSSTTSPGPATAAGNGGNGLPPSRRRHRRLVRLGRDAVRPAALPVRERRAASPRRRIRAPPTSSPRRSTRPAAGSTPCTSSASRALRLRSPSALHRHGARQRRAGAQDVEAPRQRRRPDGGASRRPAPTPCAGTSTSTTPSSPRASRRSWCARRRRACSCRSGTRSLSSPSTRISTAGTRARRAPFPSPSAPTSIAGSSAASTTRSSKVALLLEGYRIAEPARRLEAFVDDLNNWYIRRSRDRFWAATGERKRGQGSGLPDAVQGPDHSCASDRALHPLPGRDAARAPRARHGSGAPASVHLEQWPEPPGFSSGSTAGSLALRAVR